MAQSVNLEALRRYRKRKGWTQQGLADALRRVDDKVRVGKDTVYRWEKGRNAPRARYISALAKVFGISEDALKVVPSETDERSAAMMGRTVQLNVRVSPRTRNALRLLGSRYRLLPADIVELAPITLFIVAEQSLASRRAALDEASRRFDELAEQAVWPRHMPIGRPFIFDDEREIIAEEENAIKKRNLFDPQYLDREEEDVFGIHLRKALDQLAQPFFDGVWASSASHVHYTIAPQVFAEIFGVPAGEDGGVYDALGSGDIDLGSAAEKRRELSWEDFAEWCRSEAEAARQEHLDALDLKLSDFGLPDPAPESGEGTDA